MEMIDPRVWNLFFFSLKYFYAMNERFFFKENFHEIEVSSFPFPLSLIFILVSYSGRWLAIVAEASNETLLIDLLFSTGI